jgi:two-component system, OmpR family, alkaline phosphatase synthesis response regulator PhoP
MSEPVRVLAADDDADILTLVEIVLTSAGYEVVLAHDGLEALELAVAHRPSLLVLDVMMPRLDGLEATRRLRATEGFETLPIILLTARVTDADAAVGLEAGATDYLLKPFNPRELRERVAAALADATSA